MRGYGVEPGADTHLVVTYRPFDKQRHQAIAMPNQQPTNWCRLRERRGNTKIHGITVFAGSTLLFHSLNYGPELQGWVLMKTIGILGGMSAASTQIYYATLCRLTREQLGGLHSPDLLIRSLDFAGIEALQKDGNWEAAGALLNREARALEAGGAELLLLATNTMHMLADSMMEGLSIPLPHIVDATADRLRTQGCRKPALMATRFTMDGSFYRGRLEQFGLQPVMPDAQARDVIHGIIYSELCQNLINPASRDSYLEICADLQRAGADALILGCTEIGLLLNDGNVDMPVFDTTQIHCEEALRLALA